jgi:glycosyltransferase involved in cell wall biosynthesis
MNYDVTIGIPVYKSVDCIKQSIESALSQSYSSIEFLIIDDAGHDGSIDIIRDLQASHPRGKDIHIVSHTVNLGVSKSRNEIIEKAQGDYMYFMDSDDIIAPNTISLLMQKIRQYDAEIVFGSYEKIETSGKRTVYQYPSLQLLEKDALAVFAYRKYAGIQASACNYVVKTDILRVNNHRFIDVDYWEDLVFTFDLVTLVSRAVLLPDIIYFYQCRENSLSHYQERINISKAEVMRNVEAIEYLKRSSVSLCDKEYFSNRCYIIAMSDFYIACAILKKRKTIIPYITNLEIKRIMKHSASWNQICSFRRSRFKNQLLYILGKTPSFLCVFIIKCLGKIKKII